MTPRGQGANPLPKTQILGVRMPRAFIRALKLYVFDHHTTFQAVGEDAWRTWARAHGFDEAVLGETTNEDTADDVGALSGAA